MYSNGSIPGCHTRLRRVGEWVRGSAQRRSTGETIVFAFLATARFITSGKVVACMDNAIPEGYEMPSIV